MPARRYSILASSYDRVVSPAYPNRRGWEVARYFPGDHVVTCTGCKAIRGKDGASWTTCRSCVASPVPCCPRCIGKHVAAHVKRPVVCWLATQPEAP